MDDVQDLMVNVDLTNSQYSLSMLFDEAQKVGMDLDDLKEYGFDDRAMRCASKTCKGMDQDFNQVVGQHSERWKDSSMTFLNMYEKI